MTTSRAERPTMKHLQLTITITRRTKLRDLVSLWWGMKVDAFLLWVNRKASALEAWGRKHGG